MKKIFQHSVFYVGVSLLLITGCGGEAEEDQNPFSKEEQESVEVRQEVVFTVTDDQPVYQYVQSSGVVEANQQVTLKPKISGFVEALNLREGRWVQKGDTLLSFDKQELKNAVAQAQNEYDKTLNIYRSEKRLEDDEGNLGSNGSDSTNQRDQGIRLRVGLAQAEVALNGAKIDLSYATLTAPFSGNLSINGEQRISEGAYITAGTAVGELVNDGTVQVRIDVLEAELPKIKTGQAVEVTTPNGQSLKGTLSAILPVIDTDSKTGEVIARVNNRQQLLRAGNTVDVRILIQKETGKARIPRAAILSRDGGRTLVFKLHPGNNEVEWIYVEPQAQNSEWAIINNEGIAPGDTLAVENHFSLSHLQIVSPKMQSLQQEPADDAELNNQ